MKCDECRERLIEYVEGTGPWSQVHFRTASGRMFRVSGPGGRISEAPGPTDRMRKIEMCQIDPECGYGPHLVQEISKSKEDYHVSKMGKDRYGFGGCGGRPGHRHWALGRVLRGQIGRRRGSRPAIRATWDSTSVHLQARIRTIPHDNFEMIGLTYDFVDHDLGKNSNRRRDGG